MRVRGRRRCRACGTEWSYFETGAPTCPDCGSPRSVAVDADRTLHTATPVTLDLSTARSALRERPLREAAEAAEGAARRYAARRGFVHAGELQPLDATILAALELRFVAAEVRRRRAPAEAVEAHFLDLLADAEDGERPDEVPPSLRSARGLAAATAVGDYCDDGRAWLDEHPDRSSGAVRACLDDLRTHERRIEALDGDVAPSVAAHLVAAARALGEHLQTGAAEALERARQHLDALSDLGAR